MTSEEFRAALAALSLSQQAFGRAIGVDSRTVQRWALGERAMPPTVTVILRLLATRVVTPPPAGSHPSQDRDEPCCQAIEPHLDTLMRLALAAGWTEPEVMAAALGLVVHGTMEHAGVDAARELLADATEVVEMMGAEHAHAN